MTNTQNQVTIPVEEPSRAGGIWLDHRVWWAGGFVFLAFTLIGVSSLVNQQLTGLVVILALAILVAAFVGLPWMDRGKTYPSAKLYRWMSYRRVRKRGHDYAISYLVSRGELNQRLGTGDQPDIVKVLGRFDLYPLETEEGVAGIVRDHRTNFYAGSVEVNSSWAAQDDEEALAQRVAHARVLDLMARSGIDRLAWSDETLIGEHVNPQLVLGSLREGSSLPAGDPKLDELFSQRMLERAAKSIVHRTTYTLALDGYAHRNEIKQMAQKGGAEAVLLSRLFKFQDLTKDGSSGIQDTSILDYNDLVSIWRRRLEPTIGRRLQTSWEPQGDIDLLAENLAWPDTWDIQPNYYRAGGCWHTCFYSDDFGKHGMSDARFLDLVKVPVPKIVTVICRPVPMKEAQKQVLRSTSGTAGYASERTRKMGRLDAFAAKELEDKRRQESELANLPHEDSRLRCFVDVMGSSLEEAETNAGRVLTETEGAGFVFLPLDFLQHLGLESTLLAGRGLKDKPN